MEEKPERTGVAKAQEMGDMAALFDHRLHESEQTITATSSAKRSKLRIMPRSAVEDRVCPWIEDSRRNMAAVNPNLRDELRSLASGQSDWPLFLYGEAGRGKTSAALALADFCEFSLYYTLENLCNEVMSRDLNWDVIGWADLAILDEIGARERASDLAYSSLLNFWDRRERRGQRSIYISNVTPEDINRLFDNRIASRILTGTVIKLTGDDRRNAK